LSASAGLTVAGPFVVAITGASSGIGSALARAYAAPGVLLWLTGRDATRLAAVAELCRSLGAEVESVTADVTDAAAMRDLLTGFDQRHPIDLVIANAGITSGRQPNGEPESWRAVQQVFAVNLMGVLHTLTPVIERMRPRRRGQIAVIGSIAARRGLPSCPAYSASKAAVETYGSALRGSLADDGIKVSVVSPGYVASPMSDRVKGAKPFVVGADRAARIIRQGLAGNRPHIAFPWPLTLGTAIVAALPAWLADPLLRLFAFSVSPEPAENAWSEPRGAIDAR
jgi:short-subunit dehydrogenase